MSFSSLSLSSLSSIKQSELASDADVYNVTYLCDLFTTDGWLFCLVDIFGRSVLFFYALLQKPDILYEYILLLCQVGATEESISIAGWTARLRLESYDLDLPQVLNHLIQFQYVQFVSHALDVFTHR